MANKNLLLHCSHKFPILIIQKVTNLNFLNRKLGSNSYYFDYQRFSLSLDLILGSHP